VAIVTPYFNTGPLFHETVASLHAQTLQQWEWVIVDDGSTDPAALAVLEPLRQGDARVRVIDQPNRGLPAARNAGVAATSAPLLFFLDSDDLLAPTALEKMAWLLHSDARPAFTTGWRVNFGAKHELEARGFDARDHFLWEHTATALIMIRRAAFEAVGGYDESLRAGLEDYELGLRLAAAGYWGRDIPEYLLRVRFKQPAEYPGYAWPARDERRRLAAFVRAMQARYPRLYREGLPHLPERDERPFTPLPPAEAPFANQLSPQGRRRLLLLLPNLNAGGVATVALAMLARLQRAGDHLTVCATDFGPQALEDAFARHAALFVLDRFLERADRPRFLVYLIRSRQIDAVLLHDSVLGYRLLPFLRAHCPSVALLDYCHMREPIYANEGQPGFSAEYHELLDMHLASSEALRCWLVGRGVPAERCATLYAGLDAQHWRPDPELRRQVRAELGLGEQEALLLFAGRMTPQKQPWLLADILLHLERRGLPFRCLAAGDGPELPKLRAALRRHGLERRTFLPGQVEPERMHALMVAADVFLLPSAYEGLAVTLFEAMASGAVPVAADTGGQRELVTPECGLLLPLGGRQAERYAAAVEWLLRAPRQREAMARAGRRRVEALLAESLVSPRLDELVEQALWLARERPQPRVSPGAATVATSAAVELLRHYERNRRFGLALRAWQLWQQYERDYAGGLRQARDKAVLRSYPLRRALRPYWHRLRRLTSRL
jgi:glycosyltransferase involved in cell wall biosynthesis